MKRLRSCVMKLILKSGLLLASTIGLVGCMSSSWAPNNPNAYRDQGPVDERNFGADASYSNGGYNPYRSSAPSHTSHIKQRQHQNASEVGTLLRRQSGGNVQQQNLRKKNGPSLEGY